MRPAVAILVDGLDATREAFVALFRTESEARGNGFVRVGGWRAFGAGGEVAEEWLDEVIVGVGTGMASASVVGLVGALR